MSNEKYNFFLKSCHILATYGIYWLNVVISWNFQRCNALCHETNIHIIISNFPIFFRLITIFSLFIHCQHGELKDILPSLCFDLFFFFKSYLKIGATISNDQFNISSRSKQLNWDLLLQTIVCYVWLFTFFLIRWSNVSTHPFAISALENK
jgi:hypothetical protein